MQKMSDFRIIKPDFFALSVQDVWEVNKSKFSGLIFLAIWGTIKDIGDIAQLVRALY